MLQAFIVVFREGFESFLIVGVILAYLRRIGEHRLVPAMYWESQHLFWLAQAWATC